MNGRTFFLLFSFLILFIAVEKRTLFQLNSVSILLRLNLMRLSGDASCQTFDAVLELAVLGGVDERIDTAVGEHQHNSEVIE